MLMSLQRLDNVWAYIPGLVEKNCYFAKMFLGLVNSFKIPCLGVQVHHPFRSSCGGTSIRIFQEVMKQRDVLNLLS